MCKAIEQWWYVVLKISQTSPHRIETTDDDASTDDDDDADAAAADDDYDDGDKNNYLFFTNRLKSEPDGERAV